MPRSIIETPGRPCLHAACRLISCVPASHVQSAAAKALSFNDALAPLNRVPAPPTKEQDFAFHPCAETQGTSLYLAPLDWPCALPLLVCRTLLVERSTPCPGQKSSSSESGATFSAALSAPHTGVVEQPRTPMQFGRGHSPGWYTGPVISHIFLIHILSLHFSDESDPDLAIHHLILCRLASPHRRWEGPAHGAAHVGPSASAYCSEMFAARIRS